jgi:hypothetical protein
MGLRFSRNRRLSKILSKMNETQNKKRRATSNIVTMLDQLEIELESLKEVVKRTVYEDQTS